MEVKSLGLDDLIKIDPSKIRANQEMLRPVTVKQFKSFLGKSAALSPICLRKSSHVPLEERC